ncbi:MAG: ABC transporter permease [Lachnospiraceae bacterium]|nr:ABC transporter permease [Lachnospiraceae bacterium]
MTLPFENDTNSAVKKLAVQRIHANKGKNIFIILAITLTTVLFAALFAVAGGFLDQNKQVQQRHYGTAHASIKFLTQEQCVVLKACATPEEIYFTHVVGMAANKELRKLNTEVRYAQDGSARSFQCYPSVGTMPQEENEIATSTLVLEAMGIPCELGTTIHLTISVDDVLYEKDMQLCGFWEGYERAGAQMAWVSESLADSLAPAAHVSVYDSGKYGGIFCADIYFSNEWNVERKMNELLDEVGKESGIWELPVSANPSCGLGMSADEIDIVFILAAVALLGIIVWVGYLIIYNMFSISVAQDVQFFGLLRTIGASGRQIKGIVRKQAFRLAFMGLPFGLAAGYLVGLLLLPYMLTEINIDVTGIYRINPLILIGAVLFSLLTVYISSLKPCRYAAKISAIDAVRYVETDNGVRKKTKKSHRTTPYTMAMSNLRRSGRKAVLVIMSLSLSMILLNTTYTAVTGFDLEEYIEQYAVADFCVSDYSIFNRTGGPGNENLNGISGELIKGIESIPGLENSAYVYAKSIDQPIPDGVIERVLQERASRTADIRSMEDSEKMLAQYSQTGAIVYGIDGDVSELITITKGKLDEELWESGEGVIVDDFYYHSAVGTEIDSPLYRIGDEIIITDDNGGSHSYQVMAVGTIEGDAGTHFSLDLGLNIVLPMKSYRKVYGNTQPMTAVFNVADGYKEAAEDWIEDYSGNIEKNLDYISCRTYEKEFQESKTAYTMIGSVLGGILALIGLLNFINVTVTSILARQKEMAVLGAAGMAQRQMKQMLAWEGIAYIGLAVLVTATLGTGIGWFICEEMAGNMWAFRYYFTMLPVVLILPFMLAVAVLVPLGFYRKINRKSIVERLRI